MGAFVVQRDYVASDNGELFGPWVAGDVVTLGEDRAAWVLRTSPGVIEPVEESPATPAEGRPATTSTTKRRPSA